MILLLVWQDSLVRFYYACIHPKITALRTAAIVSLAVRLKELTSSLQINFMLNLFDPDTDPEIQHANYRW